MSAPSGRLATEAKLGDYIRIEQREVALWWMPGGPSPMSPGKRASGTQAFLESFWLPLGILLAFASLIAVGLHAAGAGPQLGAFLTWIAYLSAVLIASRYGLVASVLGAVIVVVHAFVLFGAGLMAFEPTLLFILTVFFLALSAGANSAHMARRGGEQAFASAQAKARGRGGATGPLGDLAMAAGPDQAYRALQACLKESLGASSTEIYLVAGDKMQLLKNLGPGTVDEGSAFSTSADPFLQWFLQERRTVVFDPHQKTELASQFGDALPDPLLPLAGLALGHQVVGFIRVTASDRPAYDATALKGFAALAGVAEGALIRTGALPVS